MTMPEKVRIVEVGPRDGLQNEAQPVSTDVKIELIERLADAGLRVVEAGSFVSARKVPQMADTADVFRGIVRREDTTYPALVPNEQGLKAAMGAGVKEIALFVSASESFSRKNINCSRTESLERIEPIADIASVSGLRMRGYVSCVAGCPYEGEVDVEQVATMARALIDLGCYEVSLGDTIGVGTAQQIRAIISRVAASVPLERIAMHFHDTYGQGVANTLASLEEGVSTFDSSVAGLGGCPFAPGASGNVATEDLLYLMDGLGIETGVDLHAVAHVGEWISEILKRPNAARAGRAILAARARAGG